MRCRGAWVQLGIIEQLPNFVGGGAFRRDSANRSNPGAKFLWRHIFPERCARGLGNAFFHERATEIIGAGLQTCERHFEAKLYPGGLQVLDHPVKQHARKGMHSQVPLPLRPRPRPTMAVEPRILGAEPRRHEYMEASGARSGT